jgi:multidrug efflux pump subunit AcrB
VSLPIQIATPIARDILPINRSPAVQVLTFYGGMPSTDVEKDITTRMERWTGQAAGQAKQESRSIIGASVVRNYYRDDTDPNGALTQVNSLATAAIPYLPPGTLPPVILPFDPTATTPVCLVALDSPSESEAILYDTGRFEVRNMIFGLRGAIAPVVYGGKMRAVLAYMDRDKMQARNLSPTDLMNAIDRFNIFLPTGGAKFGTTDYALASNSMYELPTLMGDIPIKSENGKTIFLKDVAKPEDASMIQTNIVRVNGRRQVYIPVYRQQGASTLDVVENLRSSIPSMKAKLTHGDIDLKVVMDQSVYVRSSIESLMEEGILGAVLCSLVILIFLGEWRMTLIAVLTIPIAVFTALVFLNATDNTINVMTLAGLSLAIGPLVDSAIICLENTHRHLGLGAKPKAAAFYGASEVAMPELVASCCTLLVLAPLAMMPGLGKFLFRPMALAVTFAMVAAYLLSRTLVPALCSLWLRGHAARGISAPGLDLSDRNEHEHRETRSWIALAFERWESLLDRGIQAYTRFLDVILHARVAIVVGGFLLLIVVVAGVGSQLRREFFPEVDAGAFEIYVRGRSGTRIEETEKRIADVEAVVKSTIGKDLQIVISEIGVTADWSAAYTPNAGPMDSVVKIQLEHERERSAQDYVAMLRDKFLSDPKFEELEFAFDAGGMIRSAMNEGKSTPINIQITTKDENRGKAYEIASQIMRQVKQVPGVVDARILQRLDYPEYIVDVDQAKAASLGLSQMDVMRNLVAALNSSIQFNKRNFWIDPVSRNQYYVGVQYPEEEIQSIDTILDVPITSLAQKRSIPLGNMATVRRANVPAELTHTNLQSTIDLTMGVHGRDLGHVADDVAAIVAKFGKADPDGTWHAFDPTPSEQKHHLVGSRIRLSGEYSRMQDTFRNLGLGLVLASLLIYFLMVGLFRSWIIPLVILTSVPFGLVGVVMMLYLTGTALNVQSLLGIIFMVGIVVSNTVLLVDHAQHLRRDEKMNPTEAIMKAASVRIRPVVMTALAAFFALLPMALGLARGSEANTPLGRAVIGGLLAGLVTTLIVVPSLFSLVVRDAKSTGDPGDVIPDESFRA